jgi:hypothetical protein
MLPIWTEGDRTNNTCVSSQRRNSLHTFDTGIWHQFIRISQHFLLTSTSSTTGSTSRKASTPTSIEGKERKPMETIPFPPEEKKKK